MRAKPQLLPHRIKAPKFPTQFYKWPCDLGVRKDLREGSLYFHLSFDDYNSSQKGTIAPVSHQGRVRTENRHRGAVVLTGQFSRPQGRYPGQIFNTAAGKGGQHGGTRGQHALKVPVASLREPTETRYTQLLTTEMDVHLSSTLLSQRRTWSSGHTQPLTNQHEPTSTNTFPVTKLSRHWVSEPPWNNFHHY